MKEYSRPQLAKSLPVHLSLRIELLSHTNQGQIHEIKNITHKYTGVCIFLNKLISFLVFKDVALIFVPFQIV